MFSDKKNYYSLLLFLYANVINIAFFCAHLSGVGIIRPVIVYEYLLIPVFIILRFHPLITLGYFIFIFILDLIGQISFTYLFTIPELAKNLEFTFLYHFSFYHYAAAALFILYMAANYYIIKKFTSHANRSCHLIIFFTIFFVVVYTIDYLNGGSLVNNKRIVKVIDVNIGGSSIYDIGKNVNNLLHRSDRPISIDHSVALNTFAKDSTGSQLLIVMESWGLPADSAAWSTQRDMISDHANVHGWHTTFGSTHFKGSTTSAELRELLGVSGDYRYFLNADSALQFKSLFTIKKRQGYRTLAVHSFSAKMFERAVWWKNIGIDKAYFLENVVKENNLTQDKFNYETPFPSLYDEDAFNFITSLSTDSDKVFAYLLTENTHLPFYPKRSDISLATQNLHNKLSIEANQQQARIQQLLVFFIKNLSHSQWHRVLIIGDHMPPFTKSTDREFYDNEKVPYVVLSSSGH